MSLHAKHSFGRRGGGFAFLVPPGSPESLNDRLSPLIPRAASISMSLAWPHSRERMNPLSRVEGRRQRLAWLHSAVEACITRARRHFRCHRGNGQVFFSPPCAARPEGIERRDGICFVTSDTREFVRDPAKLRSWALTTLHNRQVAEDSLPGARFVRSIGFSLPCLLRVLQPRELIDLSGDRLIPSPWNVGFSTSVKSIFYKSRVFFLLARANFYTSRDFF